MNTRCCCQLDPSDPDRQANAAGAAADEVRPPKFAGRCLGIAQWILPSAVLALMPKCPACVAAYVALATGIGISVPAAAYIRTTLGVLSVGALVFLLARSMHRTFLRMTTPFRA